MEKPTRDERHHGRCWPGLLIKEYFISISIAFFAPCNLNITLLLLSDSFSLILLLCPHCAISAHPLIFCLSAHLSCSYTLQDAKYRRNKSNQVKHLVVSHLLLPSAEVPVGPGSSAGGEALQL